MAPHQEQQDEYSLKTNIYSRDIYRIPTQERDRIFKLSVSFLVTWTRIKLFFQNIWYLYYIPTPLHCSQYAYTAKLPLESTTGSLRLFSEFKYNECHFIANGDCTISVSAPCLFWVSLGYIWFTELSIYISYPGFHIRGLIYILVYLAYLLPSNFSPTPPVWTFFIYYMTLYHIPWSYIPAYIGNILSPRLFKFELLRGFHVMRHILYKISISYKIIFSNPGVS